jgi:hypothetical protein
MRVGVVGWVGVRAGGEAWSAGVLGLVEAGLSASGDAALARGSVGVVVWAAGDVALPGGSVLLVGGSVVWVGPVVLVASGVPGARVGFAVEAGGVVAVVAAVVLVALRALVAFAGLLVVAAVLPLRSSPAPAVAAAFAVV